MKDLKWFALALFLTMLIVPAVMYTLFFKAPSPPPEADPAREDVFNMQVSLYRSNTNSVDTFDCYSYICGVVAAEMPASFEPEALKAQTVAAFTYMLNKMNFDPSHDGGAYMCDDYNHCKSFFSKDELIKKWGDSYYNKMYPKIEQCVYEVLGKMLTYGGSPINAVFHAMSCGTTASAKEVWGSDIPYLQSADCAYDKSADSYISTYALSTEEFAGVFYEKLGVVLPSDESGWLGEMTYHPSGYVDRINIGGTQYSGSYIRKLFSLKSAAFDVEISQKKVTFTVFGYGHGVGMSQNGANEMAKNGCDYKEILKHFYVGTKLTDYSA